MTQKSSNCRQIHYVEYILYSKADAVAYLPLPLKYRQPWQAFQLLYPGCQALENLLDFERESYYEICIVA